MIWVLTARLDGTLPVSDKPEKNLMNFGPKSKKLYHHLLCRIDFRGGANERHTRYRTIDGGNFRQSVGNVLCPPGLPEHQENHGQGWPLEGD